jgi:hypothetical protein
MKGANAMSRNLRGLLNKLLRPAGHELRKWRPDSYDEDGLWSLHNHDFMREPAFSQAYARGVRATGQDYHFRWRVHVALWVASCAARMKGDFVECGVNRGFVSSAIMDYLDWNSMGRKFYLLDTFKGLAEDRLSEEERAAGYLEDNVKRLRSGFYVSDAQSVKRNFSEWKNVVFVDGCIPDTLARVETREVAYLHIDLNNSGPEVAAMEFFWDRLVPGAMALLDDYAYRGYQASKDGMDAFAARKNVNILSLPTGQGLLIKNAP